MFVNNGILLQCITIILNVKQIKLCFSPFFSNSYFIQRISQHHSLVCREMDNNKVRRFPCDPCRW